MTDLQALIDEGAPAAREPSALAVKATSALLAGDDLGTAAASTITGEFSHDASEHLSAFARGGDLSAGAAAAVVGAIKPGSEHDKDSLAIAASLSCDPTAAAAGYVAVQVGGDHLGKKGIAAAKILAAGAGIAAGAPALLGAYGLYVGGRELYEACTTAAPATTTPSADRDHAPDDLDNGPSP